MALGDLVRSVEDCFSNLMERLVEHCGGKNLQTFSNIWHDAGYNFGMYLQICFPTIENVVDLMDRLKRSFNIGRVEFSETKSDDESLYSLKIVAPLSGELLKYLGDYRRGLLFAYGLENVESSFGSGAATMCRFASHGKLTKVEPPILR